MHSALTLILCLILVGHLFLSSLLITYKITISPLVRGVSHSLMLILVIHILLTFIPTLLNHDGHQDISIAAMLNYLNVNDDLVDIHNQRCRPIE